MIPKDLLFFFGKDNIQSRDKAYIENTGVNVIRLPLKGYISGRAIFTKEIFKTVESLRPDILYIHGNDTLIAMQYLLGIKKLRFPIVMDSHMLEIASLNRFNEIFRYVYRKIFSPILIKNKIPVIRTQDDTYVEKCLGIPLAQCPWISVGSDTLLFYPDKKVKDEFRKGNGINNDDFVVVYAGKLSEGKGGKLLAKTFKDKFDTNRNLVLVVVGNAVGTYGKEVEEIFKKSKNRIIRFPTQKYINLPRFYQMSDLAVFPKQCSLSFYDAQACGLPVISEDNKVNIDRLKYNNGLNFKANSIEDFRKNILKFLHMPNKKYQNMKLNAYQYVKNNYDYKKIAKQYTEILEKEYKRFYNKSVYIK